MNIRDITERGTGGTLRGVIAPLAIKGPAGVALRLAELGQALAPEEIQGASAAPAIPPAHAPDFVYIDPAINAVSFGTAYARMIGVSEERLTSELRTGQMGLIRPYQLEGGPPVPESRGGGLAMRICVAGAVLTLAGLVWLWS